MFIVFPGQGSQKMHMGRAWEHDSKIMGYVQQASEITNTDITHLIMSAESDELNQTQNAQLAIFVLSYALFKKYQTQLEDMHGKAIALAGHSLGEYTALAAAGVLSFEDACLLIKERSLLMQQASHAHSGKMLAVLNISATQANVIALQASDISTNELCFVANYNSSTQIVLSGSENAITRAQDIVQKMGKRGMLLPVSGAFHTPYMKDACTNLLPVIDKLTFSAPSIPVFSNIYASSDIDWKESVAQHMVSPVRWQETLANMSALQTSSSAEKSAQFIEVGPTTLLTNMACRDAYSMKYIQDELALNYGIL